VGSLEKRGAFENHKKQYCVVDLANRSADWKVLPCKDFYEFDLGAPKSGVDLMGLLLKQLDKQIGTTDLKGNIVKAGISVSSEDIGHLNPEAIMAALTARGCSFVYPPAISVKTERALRSDVKELGSDTETWSQYIQGLVTDKEFAAQLIAVGNSIIAEEEA
jgi:hypothetical protein